MNTKQEKAAKITLIIILILTIFFIVGIFISLLAQNLYIFEGDTIPLEKKYSQNQLDSLCLQRGHVCPTIIRFADLTNTRTHFLDWEDRTMLIRENTLPKRYICQRCGKKIIEIPKNYKPLFKWKKRIHIEHTSDTIYFYIDKESLELFDIINKWE